MTVFLTTQYLEEADELAGRVGIITDGRIVAEGSPDELKRRVGKDVVVVRLDGDATAARSALSDVAQVEQIDHLGRRAAPRGPRRPGGGARDRFPAGAVGARQRP